MGDLRRPRLNMRDQKSPKLPLDLTIVIIIIIIIIVVVVVVVVVIINHYLSAPPSVSFPLCLARYHPLIHTHQTTTINIHTTVHRIVTMTTVA